MYKVFINGNLLYISPQPLKNQKNFKKVVNVEYTDASVFTNIIDLLEDEEAENRCYCVYGPDTVLIWRKFRKNYKLVTAAGGLVRNKKNKILFIFRNKKWDLPKGKAEEGELIEETALREVKEECGMEHLILLHPLTETYHTYGPRLNRKLKKTWWFKMYSEAEELIPQEEEGITKIKWIREEKLEKVFSNTFSSIVDVVAADLAFVPGETKPWHKNVNFE